MQKGQTPVLVLIGILIIIAVAGGAYYLGRSQTPVVQIPQPTITPQPTPIPDETANWKTYTNKLWSYSIKYPPDQLVACNPTDDSGLRLWTAPFDCPVAHDIFYEISIIGYKKGEYKQYKNPVSTKEITIVGIKSTQNIYKYENEDGPLQVFGGSTEILVPTQGGIVQITLLGDSIEKQNRFNKILSTFKFTQ